MKMPKRLEGRLRSRDASLYGAVLKSAGDFQTWLEDRRLVFFPEYTDHGLTHVERVLRGADWLLPNKTFALLGPGDVAVLVLSIVLHDCAMHLSRDGFLRIIDRESNWPPEPRARQPELLGGMHDPSWPDMWDRFLGEASRWDDQKRVSLFGRPQSIRRPPEGDAPWSDDDFFLVGEFLRRHHPRLAHEIAIYGVPGPSEDTLKFTGLDDWMADLTGLVARSHGLALRSAVDRLRREDRPDMRGVHAALLMSLIRIADYLEIDASRTPDILLKIRRLRSPISRQEWEKHISVPYMKIDVDDPESLWIDAAPRTSETFVGLQDLFAGLQGELDASWAVLGEVYKGDARFALRIRRIRSSLDDLDAICERAPFVPVRAKFDSAGGDLLKLMVGPLYSHQPAYGIRELTQNAVDACREIEDLVSRRPELERERSNLDADIVVTVQEEHQGQGWITVDDRGIGMTPDVIVNYFLKAGASLRDSEAWHERHDDSEGMPRVARTGRFGLGVLATFLLGDEVEVTTRHADQAPERGVQFVARLDAPNVELRWCKRPIGTTLRVRVTRPDVFEALADVESWDWYRLKRPSVLRRIRLQTGRSPWLARKIPAGPEVTLEHGELIPHGDDPLPPPWRRLPRKDFGEILWSLRRGNGREDVANGFALKRPDLKGTTHWPVLWPPSGSDSDFFLFRPRIATMEGTALLPVDLRRTETVTPLPFEKDLTTAVCRDILASVLVRALESPEDLLLQIGTTIRKEPAAEHLARLLWHPAISTDQDAHGWKLLWHPGMSIDPDVLKSELMRGNHRVGSWLFMTERGLTLEDPALGFGEPRFGVAFLVAEEGDVPQPPIMLMVTTLKRVPPGFPVGIQKEIGSMGELEERRRSLGYASAALVCRTNGSEKDNQLYQGFTRSDLGNGWTVLWTGDDPTRRLDLVRLCGDPSKGGYEPLVLFLLPEGAKSRDPRNPLSQVWRELLHHAEIPYERRLRKEVLARAFRELQGEIELWQQLPATARYWV